MSQIAFNNDLSLEGPQAPALAPSWLTHVAVLLILTVVAVPSALLFLSGQMLSATLLMGIPFSIVCILDPFIGLCWLFAISPIDSIYEFGIPNLSGSKVLSVPIALGFMLHLLVRRGSRFRIPRELKLLWLLALWAFLALTWCIQFKVSFFCWTQLLLLSAFTVMVVGLAQSQQHIRQLLFYVFLGSLITGTYAVLHGSGSGTSSRSTFSEVNPNLFGRSLIYGLFAAIFILAQTRGLAKKFFFVACGLMILIAIAATQSRGTFMALAAGIAGGILITYRHNFLKVLLAMVGTAAVLLTIGFMLIQFNFYSSRNLDRLMTPLSEAGQSRFDIWGPGLKAGMDRPLTGWGFGIFQYASRTGRDPHDVYLKMFVELGLPGLTLWLAVLLSLQLRAFKYRGIACFMIAGLTSTIIVSGVTINDLVAKTTWYEIGTCLAIAAAFAKQTPQYPVDQYSITR